MPQRAHTRHDGLAGWAWHRRILCFGWDGMGMHVPSHTIPYHAKKCMGTTMQLPGGGGAFCGTSHNYELVRATLAAACRWLFCHASHGLRTGTVRVGMTLSIQPFIPVFGMASASDAGIGPHSWRGGCTHARGNGPGLQTLLQKWRGASHAHLPGDTRCPAPGA